MVNTQYLDEKIKESGKSKTFLAKKLGLSRSGFYKKISGMSSFTEREATILCNELDIRTIAERRKIFVLA